MDPVRASKTFVVTQQCPLQRSKPTTHCTMCCETDVVAVTRRSHAMSQGTAGS